MDGLTLFGLLIGFAAVFVGQMIEGGTLSSLINPAAFMIVLGGTLGAVMVQTPFSIFKRAFGVLPWIVKPPKLGFDKRRKQLIELARKSRQHGLLSLEDQMDRETNPLLRRGLELLIIGVDKQTIRHILESEIDHSEFRDLKAAHVYESMGGYSPTIGILGAVLGLIQVMRDLADPSSLGMGIAVAFVATIYGVGFANLLFLPIAHKLKSCIAHQVHYSQMIVEGVVAMASGESPNMLAIKLDNYGSQKKHAPKKASTART